MFMLQAIRAILEKLNEATSWSVNVLQITSSSVNGTKYLAREITLDPNGKTEEFISEISDRYTGRIVLPLI